ncbi:hypothetical protein BgiBS90_013134 [Biomphalaria glabrata]|nr:hypothetical protein BgiBS90_013134 [Biomphalaria glabrata]
MLSRVGLEQASICYKCTLLPFCPDFNEGRELIFRTNLRNPFPARATRASPWSLPGSSEQSFVSSGHGQAIATATITSTHTGKETSRVPDSPTRASPKTLNS